MFKRTVYDVESHPDWVLDAAEEYFAQVVSMRKDDIEYIKGISSRSIVNGVFIYLNRALRGSRNNGYTAWLYASVQQYERLAKLIGHVEVKTKTIHQDGEIYRI